MTRYELLKELSKYTTKRELDFYMLPEFGWDNDLLLKLLARKIYDTRKQDYSGQHC